MLFPAAAEEVEEEEDALPLSDVGGGSDGASFGVGGKKRGFSIASAGFALGSPGRASRSCETG